MFRRAITDLLRHNERNDERRCDGSGRRIFLIFFTVDNAVDTNADVSYSKRRPVTSPD
jgi:hypothetical protein